jgi:hypothetical protein
MYKYIYIYIYIYMNIYSYIYIYVHIYIYIHECVFIYVYIYTYMSVPQIKNFEGEPWRELKRRVSTMMMFIYTNYKRGSWKICTVCFHMDQPEKYKIRSIIIRNKWPYGPIKSFSGCKTLRYRYPLNETLTEELM